MSENELPGGFLKGRYEAGFNNYQHSCIIEEMISDTPAAEPDTRKKIWEVESHLRCPLIGGCLTIDEHRRVLNKAGCTTKRKRPYELHSMIMSSLNNENVISRKVDNFLCYKYRRDAYSLLRLDEDQFMDMWNLRIESGDIEVLYYAAAVKNNLSSQAIEQIFGDVHMISHINLHEINRVKMILTMHEKTNIKLAGLFQQQKKKNISQKKEISGLKSSLADLTNINAILKKSAKSENIGGSEVVRLRSQNYELSRKVISHEKHISKLLTENKRLERQKRKMEIKNIDLEASVHQLNDEMRTLLNEKSMERLCDCDRKCPDRTHCPGKVLVVGGKIRMKRHYKDLIESHGGEFEYHDGCVKGGRDELENRIRRCDLIFCPVNCNSHGACESVKKYCQRYGKPFKMLSSSSLSSIARAISESANN